VTGIVVSDPGPLIPSAVHSELRCSAGLPGASALRQAIKDGWINNENEIDRALAEIAAMA